MKTYKQTVDILARYMAGRYFGGSNEYYSIAGDSVIAMIYDVPARQLQADVESVFKGIVSETVAKHRRLRNIG